ncbi:MAG: hypothetical protein LBS05_10335, partial [Tannerellaceae bacterium]|nr:hypothetical protein [Tannerellaceae bacterium]
MKKFYLFLTLFMAVCFCPGVLFATDNAIVLGGVASTGQLRINVNAGGNYCVYRYFNSNWYKQFYATNSHLFAIKIGSTTFASGGTTMPSAGSITSGSVTAFTTIADVASSISGTAHYMTKKFTGSYSGYSFSVTITIRYNTSSMDYLVKEAVLDMSNIPSGTAISFAYG